MRLSAKGGFLSSCMLMPKHKTIPWRYYNSFEHRLGLIDVAWTGAYMGFETNYE